MRTAWRRIALMTGASALALGRARAERSPDSFEFGLLHGLRVRGLL